MSMTRLIGIIALSTLIYGCALSQWATTMGGPDYAVVRVFFATDRNLTGSKKPDEMFGADRSMLSYGTCNVSIPRDHRMGELGGT